MSNEELCLLIQQGHEELVPELWTQCVDFISMVAGKYIEDFPQLDESIKQDCVQEAYFNFMNAVKLYKPQESSFIHYLNYHLKNAFRSVCCGGRSRRLEMDPLNHSLSLDAQLRADGEDFTLADIVAEKEEGVQTEYSMQPNLIQLENADYWKSVNRFMHNTFDKSSDDVGKEIYHYMLDNDCGYKDAIIALYGEDAFDDDKLINKLTHSRRKTQGEFIRYWNSGKGKEERRKLALDNLAVNHGLRSYGLKRFLQAGFTSYVEEVVIRHIEG